MARVDDRALALAHAASASSDDGRFSAKEIDILCDRLKVPRLSNVSVYIKRLAGRGHVVKDAGMGRWALTPLGEVALIELLGSLDYVAIDAASGASPGAEFAHVRHSVIDPAFAPGRWGEGITRLLAQFPFEKNVFCMTRFPSKKQGSDQLPDVVAAAIKEIREAVSAHGLVLHLASDRQIDDDVLGNIGAHMWACRYGIGILEDRIGRGLNYNVVTEIGGMLITGRRCALLKDLTAPALPVDIAGQIYKAVDLDDKSSVRAAAHLWLSRDLSLGSCDICTSIETET